jgi:transposase-like protein
LLERNRYTEEFKIEAVRLMLTRGERTVSDVAEALGVRANRLHRWRQRYESAVRNPAEYKRETAERAEVRRQRKQVEELKTEREILKRLSSLMCGWFRGARRVPSLCMREV